MRALKFRRKVIIFCMAFVIALCCSIIVYKVVGHQVIGHQPRLVKPSGSQWWFYVGILFLCISTTPLPFIESLKYKKLLNLIFLSLGCTFMLLDEWHTVTVGHQPIFYGFCALYFLVLAYVILRDIRNWNSQSKTQSLLVEDAVQQGNAQGNP